VDCLGDLDAALKPPRSVAVVGGGWAGCAAAATLAAGGARVLLYEAASELGGRARRLELELAGRVHRLDNGQHLMVGAYTSTARLLRDIGVDLGAMVERRPFELRYPDGFRLEASLRPAPWHLVTALAGARGLRWRDRIAMARLLQALKATGWSVGPDRDAAGWLARHGQSPALVSRLWRPLAIAALNTDLPDASAQLFANVLRDSLGAASDASMFWLPRADLSALLPDAVERFLGAHGGSVARGTRVDAVTRDGAGFQLAAHGDGRRGDARFDAVVYAAPPSQLRQVARALSAELAPGLDTIARFAYEPIVTAYLKYEEDVGIARGFTALLDDPVKRAYGQWVFDRGALDAANRGVLAVVISARGPHENETLRGIGDAVSAQLSSALGLPPPRDARVIAEKRATLAACPGLQRPPNVTPVQGFVLAGDWTDSDYPSTLEAAVRSGVAAARHLLQQKSV
jgi:hydroxysqualene dehydroxylase